MFSETTGEAIDILEGQGKAADDDIDIEILESQEEGKDLEPDHEYAYELVTSYQEIHIRHTSHRRLDH